MPLYFVLTKLNNMQLKMKKKNANSQKADRQLKRQNIMAVIHVPSNNNKI